MNFNTFQYILRIDFNSSETKTYKFMHTNSVAVNRCKFRQKFSIAMEIPKRIIIKT